MKIRNKILSLFLCAALLLCSLPVTAAAESDFPTVLAEAKKGVVQIYGVGEEGIYISSWVGTGFAVGESGKDSDIFLTNWHVVTAEGDYSLSQVKIWILQENCQIDDRTLEPDPNKSITCEVLKTTNGSPDYAILRATEPVSGYKPLPLLPSEQIPDGETVYALGYPAIVSDFSKSHYGIDDITSTNGIISQHMLDNTNINVLMHTAQISGGNSGGPLITGEGAVVGLNTYGFGDDSMNRYCAEYIDYSIAGLDELGLPYELFGQPSGSTDGTDEDEKNTTEETKTDDGTDKDDAEEEEDSLIPLIAGGAAVIAVACGILFIALKKKKEREEEERRRQEEARRRQEEERRRLEEERRRQEEARRQEEEYRRQAQEVRARLQLNGAATYPVRASGCVIGRDPGCSIVLPANAAGVSRRHCKLEFMDNRLILTDLGSTAGTYIHSKRIPANTPVALKPGSSFCLGSESYKFTVC